LVVQAAESIRKPAVVYGFAAIVLPVLALLTWRQAGMYTDAETLWRDTLARNPDCWLAHNNLGLLLRDQGHIEEAMEHCQKAIQLNPNYSESPDSLGVALAAQGRFDEAIECYRKAIQINPNYSAALNNLGVALVAEGRFDEAIENYYKAIQLNPNNPKVLTNLGVALADKGRFDEAIKNYRQAIQLNPNFFEALNNLGHALTAQGRFDEAIEYYRQAIQVNPNSSDARSNPAGELNNLAWMLAASPDAGRRNGTEAVRLAERACELTHYGEPLFVGTLAAAYAEAGRFPEAVATAEKAEQLATSAGLKKVAEKNQQLLELYRAGKPYHEPAAH
jgi:tetratricopeptide (TPR) repeat protein